MKKLLAILTAVMCMAAVSGCGEQQSSQQAGAEGTTHSDDAYGLEMSGTVTNVWEGSCEIETPEGVPYHVSLTNVDGNPCTVPAVGDQITVFYDGKIAESFPAQILSVYEIRVIGTSADAAKWGITLKAEKVSAGGMTLICSQSGGEHDGKLEYGSDYRVEVLDGGRWQPVEPIIDNAAWTTVAYTLAEGSTEKQVIDWRWLYGELTAGQYRIGKSFMNFRDTGDFDKATAYAMFTVPEEPPVDDEAALRNRVPEMFDLSVQKGLWIYVTTFGGSSYRYSLMMGKNLGYTYEEVMKAEFVQREEMQCILSTYDIPQENITLMPYQHPLSGFLWMPSEDELHNLAAQLGIPDASVVGETLMLPEPSEDGTVPASQLAYANHYRGENLFFGALNRETFWISSVLHLPIFKMESRAELEQFKNGYCADLTIDSGYGEVPSFNKITAAMDDAFFEQYTLLVVYIGANSGSYRYALDSVAVNGEHLCVHVRQVNFPEAVTMDMAGWFLTVPVEKSALEGVRYFDADLNHLP